jgi:hypothetical protein
MYVRVHSDIWNVPRFILPGVKLQIKYTKAKQDICLMSGTPDSKTKFISARLYVRSVRANPRILLAHETPNTRLAIYNLTRVELKNFTFSSRTVFLDR